MDKNALVRDLLSFVLAKVSLEESTPARCLACKLMGIITPQMTAEVVREGRRGQDGVRRGSSGVKAR